jgi:hypothetical protein
VKQLILATAALLFLAACDEDRSATYTLYRNSPLEPSVRVHWATFNATDKGDYNRGNCTMAARLLNANVKASAKAEGKEPFEGVGFWCELGKFKEKGNVPSEFDTAFPATSDSPLSW